MKKLLSAVSLLALSSVVFGQKTEIKYLSGTGLGDTKNWAFYCTGGQNSEKWDSIAVPSQWELEGYGEYTYGRWYKVKGGKPSTEKGLYKTTFDIPANWKNKAIVIVFEGVMTDALVKVNGQQAGDIHQGAFYEFSYNITNLIQPGKTNTLEVEVAKESQNRSINAAERKADWWTFGGIYRPVYIKAMPEYNISNIAVDAKADGSLRGKVFTSDIPKDYIIEMEINPAGAKGKFPKQSIIVNGGTEHPVIAKWDKIDVWGPENPNLYDLTVTLKNDKKKTVHQHTERIGFRTIDFRRKDGFYLNGTKLVMKGINRHSFHPDGGRTTNKEISIRDGQLMKEIGRAHV